MKGSYRQNILLWARLKSLNSCVTYTPASRGGDWILKSPKPDMLSTYGFATLCRIRLGTQNLTLQESPNNHRCATVSEVSIQVRSCSDHSFNIHMRRILHGPPSSQLLVIRLYFI
ncbi:hypothetical protein TNCV_3788001 [Trichonephila clavipes]|nr:hypothetical protein TNCV_3788001 [Trichonephila clavipes]